MKTIKFLILFLIILISSCVTTKRNVKKKPTSTLVECVQYILNNTCEALYISITSIEKHCISHVDFIKQLEENYE